MGTGMEHAEWNALREALRKITEALEPLSEELQARVLASSAIIVGAGERVTDILGGNA